MNLVEALPKDEEFGGILMIPGGKSGDNYINGFVDLAWFENTFSELAQMEVPLSEETYNQLKSIDNFWKMNAERWRSQGII